VLLEAIGDEVEYTILPPSKPPGLLQPLEENRHRPIRGPLPEAAFFSIREIDRPIGIDGHTGRGAEALDEDVERGFAGGLLGGVGEGRDQEQSKQQTQKDEAREETRPP
jgi:hypothetical protein